MSYFAKLTLQEFKNIVEESFTKTFGPDEYQRTISDLIPSVRSYLRQKWDIQDADKIWEKWTEAITEFGELDPKLRVKVRLFSEKSTVKDISNCKAALIHPVAFHYRTHMFSNPSEREFADEIDTKIFSKPLRDLGITVFDYEPEEYIFPARSTPMSYPPYLTRANVEKTLREDPGSSIWLSPHNHSTIPLEGRQTEQLRLDEFLKSTGTFKILPVIGPSGSGKTRLISEWMKQYVEMNGKTTDWDAGILTTETSWFTHGHARDPKRWEKWEINKNTLIVVDYTYAFDDVVHAIYKKAISQESEAPKKIRLLLLDHVMPFSIAQDFLWQTISGENIGNLNLIVSTYLDKELVLEPAKNDYSLLKHVLVASANVSQKNEQKLDLNNPVISIALEHLRSLGADDTQRNAVRHPLFAALLGQIIREANGREVDFTKISRRDLLENYFTSPDRLPWTGWDIKDGKKKIKRLFGKKRDDGLKIGALVSAATLRRGLPIIDAEVGLPELTKKRFDLFQRAGRVVSSENDHVLEPFLPDILGETFLLKFLEEVEYESKHFNLFLSLLSHSFLIDDKEIANNFHEVVIRTVRNLANDDQNRHDVYIGWKSISKILDPDIYQNNKNLRIAVSFSISDVMDIFYKYINYLDQSNENTFKIINLIEDKYSVSDVQHADSDLISIQSAESFFKFAENTNLDLSLLQDTLIDFSKRIKLSSKGEMTGLFFAIHLGMIRCVKYLLSSKNNETLISQDDSGWNAMMYACKEGHLSIVKYLYHNYPELIRTKSKNGSTAIQIATLEGQIDIVEYLYEKAPDTAEVGKYDSGTALMNAALNGHLDIVKFLHNKNSNLISQRSNQGITPMMLACENGHYPIVDFLYSQDKDQIIATTDNGWTTLMVASEYGEFEIVKFLCQKCPDLVNHKSRQKWNSLMTACIGGNLSIFKYLYNILPSLIYEKTSDGGSALMVAVINGYVDIVEFIYTHNEDLFYEKTAQGANIAILACVKEQHDVAEFIYGVKPELFYEPMSDGTMAISYLFNK